MSRFTLYATALLLTPVLGIASPTSCPDVLGAAKELIARQSSIATRDTEGGLNRTFALQDVDGDGAFEVLETASHFEAGLEFMNTELAQAFEWTTIYRCRKGRYFEATREFPSFLQTARERYELWLRLLQFPELLSDHSKQLIEANRVEFTEVVTGYIKRIDSYTATNSLP